MQSQYEVVVRPPVEDPKTGSVVDQGLIVRFRELSFDEVLMAAERARPSKVAEVAAARQAQAGMQQAITAINGRPVSYEDLGGSKWGELFSARETQMLCIAYNRVHNPSADMVARAGNGLTRWAGE